MFSALRRSRDGAVKAFRFAHTPRSTQEPLYGAVVVREYHRLLFRGCDDVGSIAGNYRTTPKPGVASPSEVARGVREMTDWLNDWAALSPVVAAAVVQVGTIEFQREQVVWRVKHVEPEPADLRENTSLVRNASRNDPVICADPIGADHQ